MGATLLKLRAWWETADKTTKTVTMVGGGLLAALLFVVFYVSSSPDMKMLFPALDATEQGRVIQKLQELKVPYSQEPDGSIFIPGSRIAETRALLATAGIPTEGSGGGAGRYDSKIGGMGTSSDIQDEQKRIALEEQIATTIVAMAPVASAKVHISPGSDSPFVDTTSVAKASIMVSLRASGGNSSEVASSIVRVVSGAVPGIKSEDISVVSTEGVTLWDGTTEGSGGTGIAGKKRAAEIAESAHIRKSIEAMIAKIAGPGKAFVEVNVEMNFDEENTTTTSDTPTKPVTVGSEIYGPGVTPNTIGTPPAAGAAPPAGAGNSYVSEDRVAGSTQEKSTKTVAPGKVLSTHASIMLDESVKDSQQQIQALAANLIHDDGTNPNFKVAVATAKFDTKIADEAKKELAGAKSSQMMQQILSLVPVLALIFVAFLVVKAISKTAAANKTVLVRAGVLGGGGSGALALVGAGGGGEVLADSGYRPAALPGVNDGMDLSDAASKRAEMIKAAIRPEVGDIPEKFDMNLAQLLKMADQRPESVAMLIKSWLLEEAR